MSEKTVNQLTLWAFGTPAETLAKFLGKKETTDDKGAIKAISVYLEKSKTIAGALGLKGKANKTALEAKLRELGMDLKTAFGKEVTGIVGSQEWVGVRSRVSRSGMATFTFKRIGAVSPVKITKEDAIKALLAAGMTEDEIMAKLTEVRQEEASAVDVSTTTEVVGQMEQAAS